MNRLDLLPHTYQNPAWRSAAVVAVVTGITNQKGVMDE